MACRLRRVALAALTAGILGAPASGGAADVVAAGPRQHELLKLLKRDCGSCHGLRLTGGLGPALTPQALKDKPTASLTATIMSGRAGTAMPPWRPFLTEAEAEWLVARLQRGETDEP
jgi:cytochrome c55X